MSRGPRILTERLLLRMTPEQRARWEAQAQAASVSLARWIREACASRANYSGHGGPKAPVGLRQWVARESKIRRQGAD